MNGLDIISSLVTHKCVQRGVLFGELNRDTYHLDHAQPFPVISHIILYIIVLRGGVRAVINNITHLCTPENKNLINVGFADTVADLRLNDDFQGLILVISREFGATGIYGGVPMRLPNAVTLARNDLETISEHYRIMEKNSASVIDNILDTSVFTFAVQLCRLKIMQYIFSVNEGGIPKSNATRTSMLYTRFLDLLQRHIETEHTVEYYANSLSITSHYLTKITNEFVGLPANRIIANELVFRASNLLHDPEFTLQQIADRLCFYDQSSFGKYFKKHTGKTPTDYRKDSFFV